MEKETPAKVRLSLDVTPEMKAVIDGLREGATHAQVLRQGIALLKTAKDAARREEQLALIDSEGQVIARLVAY